MGNIIKKIFIIGLILPVIFVVVFNLIIVAIEPTYLYTIPSYFHLMIFGPSCIEFPENATIHEGWTVDEYALIANGYSQAEIADVHERLMVKKNALASDGYSQAEIESMPKSWMVDKDGKVRTLGNMFYNEEKDCYTKTY